MLVFSAFVLEAGFLWNGGSLSQSFAFVFGWKHDTGCVSFRAKLIFSFR